MHHKNEVTKIIHEGIAGTGIEIDIEKIHQLMDDYVEDQKEAEKKALTPKELLLTAKKVIKLADNMIKPFEQTAEDKCWEMAIMAALSDNQFKTKELILPSVNIALPKCTDCGNLMNVSTFKCTCGIIALN